MSVPTGKRLKSSSWAWGPPVHDEHRRPDGSRWLGVELKVRGHRRPVQDSSEFDHRPGQRVRDPLPRVGAGDAFDLQPPIADTTTRHGA